ncbi:MAG: VCBS repeat-containing protein, partial [bacterium]
TVPLDPATLDSASFKAFGSMTGAHFGATNWDSAALTARLDPFADFAAGEEVTAVLTSRIRSVRGGGLGGFGWSFSTWDFGNARGVFGANNESPAGSEVRGTWAADFDSDGDIDVAVTANIPAAVAILMNDGVGRFAAPVFTGTAGDPISLFGADFDSDGDVDLAVFHNQPGSSHLEILRNDGAGNFTVAHDYTPAVLGQDVSGADFDSDGDIDLVLSDGWGSQNNVRVMTNDGSGAFSGPVNYSAGSAARGCATLDAEGDGDFDIAVANSSNGTVSLLYNDGSGAFTAQADFAAGPGPDRIAVADFTLDGFADIAVGSAAYTTVAVLENDGSGGFDVESYDCGGTSRSIAAADLDRNRTPDILLAQGSAGLTVMLNDGSGGFQAYTPYPAGSAPWDCFIADFDSDRALDIGCSNYSSGTVSLLFDAGLGLAEGPSSLVPRPSSLASVVRGILMGRQLTADGSRQALIDAAGRRVMELAAGANDVRHLAPGVYFIRQEGSKGQGFVGSSKKVIIAR